MASHTRHVALACCGQRIFQAATSSDKCQLIFRNTNLSVCSTASTFGKSNQTADHDIRAYSNYQRPPFTNWHRLHHSRYLSITCINKQPFAEVSVKTRAMLSAVPSNVVCQHCLECQQLSHSKYHSTLNILATRTAASPKEFHDRTQPLKSSLLPTALQPQRGLSVSAKAIVDASPSSFQPYLKLIRVDKPIGTWLLYWPCTWSISLAGEAGQLPDLRLLALFGMGSFFMRGAGCIVNDMWDKDFDKKVERTKLRPLASGELSMFQALCFLGVNLSLSLALLLQLNSYSVMLGASSMLLVVTYPLMKRYTYWPQACLGLTLNWGVLLAWSGIHGSLDLAVLPLYIATVLYTMTYDSIYSHQDKHDDMLIGVKSTALKFGDQTKYWLTGFAGTMLSGLTLTGVMCDQTWPYYLAVAFTGAHVTYQIYDVDLDNPDDCASKFRANSWLGLFLFVGAAFGTWKKSPKDKDTNDTDTKANVSTS